MLSLILVSVVMLRFIMEDIYMLSVIMVNMIKLSVVMLKRHCGDCHGALVVPQSALQPYFFPRHTHTLSRRWLDKNPCPWDDWTSVLPPSSLTCKG
jgi:hypothetical protein